MTQTLRMRVCELWYWKVSRKSQKFIPWVARKLPRKIKYYVVIDGMAHQTVSVNPKQHPDQVTGFDLLTIWKPKETK